MPEVTTIETLECAVREVSDKIDSLGRKVEDLVRQVETLDQDRAILEDIQASILKLETATHTAKEHQDTIMKDLKTEVKIQGNRTEEGVKEIKDNVDEHIGGLVDNIDKKKVIVVKGGFLDKLKKKLRR